ncbi:hypothetical protein HK105_206343 [Polyrhizophydium stewartii]|uniref:Uncharacterized protein n=1 Tax=Polyrhizophydium stewartii TaxID=2732419 RepID=A0ABR4N3G4_9FUNG
MHAAFALAVALAAAASPAAAQVCKKDLLVDDFAKTQTAVIANETRQVDLLGGDYGAVGVGWKVDTAKKAMVLTSLNGTSNFWFAKFDAGACFDLTGYSAIDFDLVGPAGSDMQFTLTQKLPDCSERAPDGSDSAYLALSKYAKMDGTKKHVSLPLADFAKNINGSNYDFIHLKDFTPVNLGPTGAVFEMSNLVLKGGCGVPGTGTNTGTAPSATGGSPAPTGSGSSPQPTQPGQKNGGVRAAAGGMLGAVVAAVVAAVL